METKTALLIGFNFVLYFLSFLLPFRFAFSFFLTLALILDNYYFLYSPSKNLYFLFFFFLTIFFLTNSDSIHNQYLELFPFSGHGNFSTILENIKTISKLYCKKQWTLPHNPIIRGGIYFLDHTKYLTSLQVNEFSFFILCSFKKKTPFRIMFVNYQVLLAYLFMAHKVLGRVLDYLL